MTRRWPEKVHLKLAPLAGETVVAAAHGHIGRVALHGPRTPKSDDIRGKSAYKCVKLGFGLKL